jgi:hypothetical protein
MNPRPEKALIEEVAVLRQILPSFVEKDWYVTQVIEIISRVNTPGFRVVFTGGTALSKAHGLLERFSEDVDFRILAEGQPNRRALSDFKQTIVQALRDGGFAFGDDKIRARDGNRYFSIDLEYPTDFPQADALRPHIQIEVTVRDTQLAPMALPVSSFVSTASKTPPEVKAVDCIDPVESAADKLSALAWRVLDRVRGGKYDDPSIVRHIHDLAILKDKTMANERFAALVQAAMQDDAARPKNKPELTDVPPNDKLDQMLRALSEDKEYVAEYEQFVGGVSYADAATVPHYPTALEAVRTLVKIAKSR